MPDYKKMYIDLFNRVTDAINLLQEAQQHSEALFTDDPREDVLVLPPKKQNTCDEQ